MKKYVAIGIAGLVLLSGLTCLTPTCIVSDGFRDGRIQKFTHKGFGVKTWEGELAMMGINSKPDLLTETNKMASTWEFSAENGEVASQLQKVPAQNLVRLYYHQYWYVPFWTAESNYLVWKVESFDR